MRANYIDIAVCDALRHLSTFLAEAHTSGRHHLADLYELVQYAGNIVPRLYLMVLVGSVYMGTDDAPVKEIMKDMMEMNRGVQHPIRGLFLRNYLSSQTRAHLPHGDSQGPGGNLRDSISFILTNFIEMNKLWVRLQHQGHSRERERREQERRDLRILVGTNLVRLSELEGIDKELYRSQILPALLEQVVQCRDPLAQEYLMEVITQVFSDDLHLYTLDLFLSATAKLHQLVSVRQIISVLIDRLATYAAKNVDTNAGGDLENGFAELKVNDDDKKANDGIPGDLQLFNIFWDQLVNLVKERPDMPIQDVFGMLVSLCNLALSAYPSQLAYVDKVLAYAEGKSTEHADKPDFHAGPTQNNIMTLFLAPISSYTSFLTVLDLEYYLSCLKLQTYATRRSVASAVAHASLKGSILLQTEESVNGVLELLKVLIQEGSQQAGYGSALTDGRKSKEVETEETIEEQGWLARIIHLIRSDDDDTQLRLLQICQKHFAEGEERTRFTTPSLVTQGIKLVRRFSSHGDDLGRSKAVTTLKLVHHLISQLYSKVSCTDLCMRLFVFAGQIADQGAFEDSAYEFFAQAFTLYEDGISESRAQFQALMIIAGALHQSRHFSTDNYDTLINKTAKHGSKLLQKPAQCRAVYSASHLWWAVENGMRSEEEEKNVSSHTCFIF